MPFKDLVEYGAPCHSCSEGFRMKAHLISGPAGTVRRRSLPAPTQAQHVRSSLLELEFAGLVNRGEMVLKNGGKWKMTGKAEALIAEAKNTVRGLLFPVVAG